MTFEEWAEENNLSEYGKACSRAAWQAAQEAERNRINALVIEVRAGGIFSGTAWWDSAEEIRRLIHAPT
jgi:hypothetical protein